MGLIGRMLAGYDATAAPPAWDDYWYRPVGAGALSAAGLPVTQETALRISTVWACATLISEAIGSLPLITYRRLPDGGKERATGHPLYEVLHDRPNATQTAPEFISLLQMWALMRGNGYARIRQGPRGPADHLDALTPDQCWPELTTDGTLRYQVRDAVTGRQSPVNADEIFHLRGPSLDGYSGLSTVAYARTSLGLASAAEEFGARFFGQGASPRGILSTEGVLKEGIANRAREQWQELYAGLGNAHKVAVLEGGLKYSPITMPLEDAQFLETRAFEVEDIARWYRVPLPLIGHMEKQTSWGSGIEQLGLMFLTYCILPWLKRWEAAIRGKLILAPQLYFAEFLVNALLRGDTKSRYEAYAIGRQWGWESVNSILEMENRNPVEGGDVRLQPLNMQPLGTPAPQQPAGQPGGSQAAYLTFFVHDAAGRVLRREAAALGRLARRCEGESRDLWAAGVGEFYSEHAEFVRQAMRLSVRAAATWCAEQRAELVAKGAQLLTDEWEIARAEDLAALALGG